MAVFCYWVMVSGNLFLSSAGGAIRQTRFFLLCFGGSNCFVCGEHIVPCARWYGVLPGGKGNKSFGG